MRAVLILLISVLVATVVCLSTVQPVRAQCATVWSTGMTTVTVNQCPPSEEVRDTTNHRATAHLWKPFRIPKWGTRLPRAGPVSVVSTRSQCT